MCSSILALVDARRIQPPHTVSLQEPDIVIFVQCIRQTTFLSILPNFQELNEYNLAPKSADAIAAASAIATSPKTTTTTATTTTATTTTIASNDNEGFKLI
jgi:hypothetical protein